MKFDVGWEKRKNLAEINGNNVYLCSLSCKLHLRQGLSNYSWRLFKLNYIQFLILRFSSLPFFYWFYSSAIFFTIVDFARVSTKKPFDIWTFSHWIFVFIGAKGLIKQILYKYIRVNISHFVTTYHCIIIMNSTNLVNNKRFP
jgi:hypothetical protein